MKTFKRINLYNKIVSIALIVLAITTFISASYLVESNDAVMPTVIQLVILALLGLLKMLIVSNKYDVICNELTAILNEKIEKEGYKNVCVSCYDIQKKNYYISCVRIKGKVTKDFHEKLYSVALDYLESVERLGEKAFMLQFEYNSEIRV